MSEPESRASPAYYLLPILLGILGGVIGYFVLRNRDAKKARNCLLVGIGITAVGTAGLIAMGSTGGPEFDRPLTEMPDSMPAQTEDFVDSTGYTPAWAAGKGQHQISSVCLNVNTMDDIDTPDWNWCNEYFGYLLDSGSARDGGFVDSTGYTPDWAAGKGDNQISSICSNINTMEDIDTPDWRWCNEFVGYLLDATGPAQDGGFVDSAGYTPDWAAGKGDNQISSICSNINTMENIDTPDWRWCNEFVGYLLDTMSSPGADRMPAADKMSGSAPTHEPVDPMPIQTEGFADSTGYMPDWAAGKDKTQISSICIDESIFEDIRDPDWNWCSEFFGYLLDAGSTRNSDFVDSTGHAPVWTAGRGENQMTAICTNKSTMEDTGTPDWRWCKEFLGYLLDSTGPAQDRFVDSTGYTPDWAAGKGKNQMISACTDRNTIENINTPDWNWCKEFFGYLIDDSPEGLALSDAITAPTTLESVSLDAAISEPEHAGADDLAGFYIMRTKELIAIKNRDLAECLAVDTNDLDSAGRYIERTLDSSINALAAISHISSKSQSHNLIPAVFPHFTEYKEVQTLATDCLFEKKDEAERIHGFEVMQEKISQSQAERSREAGLESGDHADLVLAQAEGFADSTGYTPDWVADKDRDQMTSICTDDDTMEGADTSDWDWCKEFFGYLLDATGPAQDGFVDSAGYTPDWVADKGENQISSICSKKNTMENVGTPDWGWCNEFFGYLLDSSPEGLALSDAITAPASLGLVSPETVIQEPEHVSTDELADYYIMRIRDLAAIKNRDLAECFMVDANDLDGTSEYVENSAVSSVNSLLVSSHILSRALSHGLSDTIFPYFMEQSEVLGHAGDCSDVKEGEADQIHGSGAVQEKISQNQAERDLEAEPEPEGQVDLNDIYISKMREATGLIMETYEECLRVDTDDLDSVNRWINNVLEKTEASGLLLDEIGPSVESDPRFIPTQTELFEAIEKAEECGQAVFAELDP